MKVPTCSCKPKVFKFDCFFFSVNQQFQDLTACLERLGKPGNPHPPSVQLNNSLLIQLGFLREQKEKSDQDIEKTLNVLCLNGKEGEEEGA